jgi:hypothetical protein
MYANQQTASFDGFNLTVLNQQITWSLNLICQVQQLSKKLAQERGFL